MDARNTGALIAKKRKALGLTQKQLAERLLISDKAVSKWENGASYPEITLLPPLAQLLGVTVDELLAGEVQEAEQTDAADAPKEQAAAPPEEAASAPQAYLADRLGSVDDKMLLAACVLILATAYCGRPYGWLTALRNLVIVLVVYIAFRAWHSKQRSRFAALGLDTAVSCRRARMTDRLFGTVWAVVLLCALYFTVLYSTLGMEIELAKIERYYVKIGAVSMMFASAGLLGGMAVMVLLILGLVGVFAMAYRRMTAETRFRPLAVVLPVLPVLIGAGIIGWQRAQAALARMPQFGDPQPMLNDVEAMGQAIDAAGRSAFLGVAIAVAVLLTALLAAWRATHGRVPLVSAIMLAVYAVIWLPSGAAWLDVGYEGFAQQPYATESITIQVIGLGLLLMLTALCAGIALLADSLKKR